MEGTIARIVQDKGFGFIRSGNTDYFFHRSAVKNAQFEELKSGDRVEFEDEEGLKGPRAADVYLK